MLVLHFVLIENIHYSWLIWDIWYAKEKQDQKQSCQKKSSRKHKGREQNKKNKKKKHQKTSSSIPEFISEIGCIFVLHNSIFFVMKQNTFSNIGS